MSTAEANVGHMHLTEPRNAVWLVALPLAVVADAAGVAMIVPLLWCSGLQGTTCLELLEAVP